MSVFTQNVNITRCEKRRPLQIHFSKLLPCEQLHRCCAEWMFCLPANSNIKEKCLTSSLSVSLSTICQTQITKTTILKPTCGKVSPISCTGGCSVFPDEMQHLLPLTVPGKVSWQNVFIIFTCPVASPLRKCLYSHFLCMRERLYR